MVSQYVNIWKSASHVEYCAVKSLSSTLILIHPSPWQPCFSFNMTDINYKSYVADSQDIFYELLHIKQNIFQVIIYCKFTQEKEYGYMIIHNSYL